ncbi:hypothetical protein FIU93_11990 [Labrenzia sp. THAF35]|nr:hypothetical protein FIU93_11990 [Labrenzia sp. THAF35]
MSGLSKHFETKSTITDLLILRRTFGSVSKDGPLAPELAAHPSRRAGALLRMRGKLQQLLVLPIH